MIKDAQPYKLMLFSEIETNYIIVSLDEDAKRYYRE